MFLTIPIYQKKDGSLLEWTTLGIGPHTRARRGRHAAKIQQGLTDELRDIVSKLEPRELDAFQLARGTQLERVRLELVLRGAGQRRKATGLCPLVVEPRWASESRRLVLAYHPQRQAEWFPVNEGASLAEQATAFFQTAWAELDEEKVAELWSNGRDLIKLVSFAATPRSLLDALPGKPRGIWDDLRDEKRSPKRGGMKVLPDLGVNITAQAADATLEGGLPRPIYREQLRLLLTGARKQPTLVVGAPGVGKTTLLHRATLDLLAADDYETHANVDRVHAVWRIAGKRIIAGMSHLGDWEQRCVELLADVRANRVVLLVEDLHLFGRIGRTRDSDRNLAEIFRGPIARGELVMIGECTADQLRQLEEDAPAFASLFARVPVAPTDSSETFRLMVHEMRALEPRHHVTFSPDALATTLDLGGSLLPGHALPGKALDLMRQLARDGAGTRDKPRALESRNVLAMLSSRSGLPEVMLESSATLDVAKVEAELASHVMGQPEAVRAAAEIVVRVKVGLVDSSRPYGVLLFAGPTGTGKTELAKALAEYLYGSASRLLRFDMSELSGHDAAARLVGDRWTPDGQLTRAVREQPFVVVLLDEIEKAHPRVHNLLLQLFDEGRLTDAAGESASFTNAVIVMTSNLGARTRAPVGFAEESEAAEVAREAAAQHDHLEAVRAFFSPELFNRIDRVVPFRPLSRTSARAIAAKEIAKLLSRRGLVDRHVFVTTEPSVVDRVVREAFRAADGARSLKRWLEDAIGTRLTEHLVASPPATMQLVELRDGEHGIDVHAEPLREREPVDATWSLERLEKLPLEALEAHVAGEVRFLEELASGPELERLSEEIRHHLREHGLGRTGSADQLFNLEAMRTQIVEFGARMEALARASRGDRSDELDLTSIGYAAIAYDGHVHRVRLFDRRSTILSQPRPVRAELLECLAESAFLRRSLGRVRDPEQHAAFIEIVRIGDPSKVGRFGASDVGLFEWLASGYSDARGECHGFAARMRDGRVLEGGTDALSLAIAPGARRVVIKVVGLGVFDFFELETGCHIRHSMSAPPEIVRVRVLAAPAERATASVLDDDSGPRLLPAVRTIRFDPSRRPGGASALSLEDYAMATAFDLQARELRDALDRVWRIRMSREETR